MKQFKLFFAAVALLLTTSTFATSNFATANFESETYRPGITYEIQKMLQDSGLIIEKEFTVTVIFKLSEDHKIEIHSVKSQNEEVNQFLEKRLNNQKLHGKGWFAGKYYELPVKVQARR